MKFREWFKLNGPIILTTLGTGGMITSTVLAVKATPEAHARLFKKTKGEKPTIRETVETCWKDYILPVGIGVGSLVCIFGGSILSRKNQASLATAYTALMSTYESYRNKIRLTHGNRFDKMIEKTVEQEEKDKRDGNPPWDRVQTFCIDGDTTPRFFDRTMEQVFQAEYAFNRMFAHNSVVTLNDFYSLLDLDIDEEGDTIGWDEYAGEALFGYRWIDFAHHYISNDDGMTICEIQFPSEPHRLDAYELAFDRAIGNHLFDLDDEDFIREKNKGLYGKPENRKEK